MSTYHRIVAVKTAARILEFLAHQQTPVTGQEVARALDLPHGTVMCHLATLDDVQFVRCVGDSYELGMKLSLFWARKKARLEAQRIRLDRAIEILTVEGGD